MTRSLLPLLSLRIINSGSDGVRFVEGMKHAILTLIRHGETTGNLNRLLQGVTDSPLTVFGQAQVDALGRTWATTREHSHAAEKQDKDAISRLDLPPPTLVVCSPIGRARKTAEAVHRACTTGVGESGGIFEDLLNDGAVTRLAVSTERHAEPGLALVIDPGLKEKDFGWKESTRGGVHVAGYPNGSGSGESKSDFLQRVHRAGAEWLQAATALASSSSSTEKIPHIVLVSHGMWISTFLSSHPPTTMSQVSGQPGFLPFAANTGMFSLKVQARPPLDGPEGADSGSTRPITDLFRANDIRHLANVKRQKGGIGRGAFDSKQTKLSSFFQQPASPSRADETRVVDEAVEASPPKKRKT